MYSLRIILPILHTGLHDGTMPVVTHIHRPPPWHGWRPQPPATHATPIIILLVLAQVAKAGRGERGRGQEVGGHVGCGDRGAAAVRASGVREHRGAGRVQHGRARVTLNGEERENV